VRKSLLACLVAGALPALAQEEPAVRVTVSPLPSGLFDLVQPSEVLRGRRLSQQLAPSLGETLNGVPGVSASYFGPAASRPVIRGLDGDRVRILQNGVGTLDASALSFDHAVPYDPVSADAIEVVRGPAAVLFGGNAIGGVVNVVDNRIPSAPIRGFQGRGEARLGGAEDERLFGAVLEAGNGRFALHADGFGRKSGDLRIPAFSRSARQRAQDAATVDQPRGRVPNSSAQANGGALGGALTWDTGHAGFSFRGQDSNYGSVAERAVRIDMESERWDFAGEARELGPLVAAVRWRLGRTHYSHRELEDGAVNTTFRNRGHEGRVEVAHARFGALEGAFGVQHTDFDFSALGAEAFVPATHARARGVFLYEELGLERWKFSLGLRRDRTQLRSAGGGPNDPASGAPRFDPATSRDYATGASALGAAFSVSPEFTLAANVSATQRAPAYYELFANGPHAATGVYEVGNTGFGREVAHAFDAGLRWKSGPHSASVSVFRQRFRDYIALFRTGNTRGADGELNPTDADGNEVADGSGEEILPEAQFRAVPARFRGIEAKGRWRAMQKPGTLDLELRGDVVRAADASTGRPLPRIAPVRIGAALDYTLNRVNARIDVLRARAQNRVAANELATDGYTLVNAHVSYRFHLDAGALEAYARITNLLDREARQHTSFVKDLAPVGGRGIMLGMRGSF